MGAPHTAHAAAPYRFTEPVTTREELALHLIHVPTNGLDRATLGSGRLSRNRRGAMETAL
jgi:hypothetical protein